MDTNVLVGGGATTIPTEFNVFEDFTQFSATPNSASFSSAKRFGRDTNLRGKGQLPQSHHFFWYQWRCLVHPMGIDLAADANKTVTEEAWRYILLTSVAVRFSQTDLINIPLLEIPSGVGPNTVSTTKTDTTNFGLGNGVPSRSNAKDVTVSGKPVSINAQEDFALNHRTQDTASFQPTADLFVKHILEGILIRGITG